MCTKSAKSASGVLHAHFEIQICILNADCEYANEHFVQTISKLNADFTNAHLMQTMSTLNIEPLLSSSKLVSN